MCRAAGRLRHRIGRRGTALLAFAALDVAVGLRLATADPDVQALYLWLDDPVPLWAWSIPWFFVAVSCTVGAVSRCDRAAFAGAIGIKVLWSSLYLSGWLLGDVADGWVSSAVYATFATCVWLIAGWPEPISGRGPTWTPPLR